MQNGEGDEFAGLNAQFNFIYAEILSGATAIIGKRAVEILQYQQGGGTGGGGQWGAGGHRLLRLNEEVPASLRHVDDG
jgi:hypothetical protein